MPEADIPGKKKGQGRSTWATGTKFKFLDARATEWQESLDNNSSTSFYTSVTWLWVKKYGWYFDYWSDLEEDVQDPGDDDLEFADGADSEEELMKCNNYFDAMRVVRIVSFFGCCKVFVNLPAHTTVVSPSL